jgi:cysteinyl-tRNA synthetase
MLKVTNTLTGKKELFKPHERNIVKMYVCGITPYDYAHIGHGRVYVIFDVLYRLLQFLDYNVIYCRNFTDIDDKLLTRAHKELGNPLQFSTIASRYIDAFKRDIEALNCLPPTHEPRVTDHIPHIVTFIQELIDHGKAYVVDGDVYFNIATFPEYTKLSKQKLEDLRAGARIEVSEKKKDPLDFALWKSEKEGTFWKSPWGYGRPGWHIECSALARHYLGEQIDIHGGGMDLIFPHHENEIAQTEALTEKQFVSYWMHNAFVRINKEKMSKSLGNFFTLRDVFQHFDPMVIRFYYLNHYYRAPLDFSFDDLSVAEKTYQRLAKFFNQHECEQLSNKKITDQALVRDMIAFLADDLNTPGMLGVVFSHLDTLQADKEAFCAVKLFLQNVLGLSLTPLPEKVIEITPEAQALIDQREKARQEKNWTLADALRDQLYKMGIEVKDEKIKK